MDYASKIKKPKTSTKRSILLMGPSGTGKSYQFRKMHDAGLKGLYACADEHTATVSDIIERDGLWPIDNPDIPLKPQDKRPDTQDFICLMDYLRSDQHDYDYLYFDSFLGFSDSLERHCKYSLNLSGYDLWGTYGEKMRMALKTLVSLTSPKHPRPVHVIATWGVEIGQDWEGRRSRQPIVSGNMVRSRVPFYFDDVFMLEKGVNKDTNEKQYLLHTSGTNEFDAKVSSGVVRLPDVIANPDLARIIAKIEGTLNK